MGTYNTQQTQAALIVAGGLVVAALVGTGSISLTSFGTASVAQQLGYKEFDIVMQNNQYNPSTITVNLGDRVVVNLTNRDAVAHAVEIPEFNATIPGGHVFPGQLARMEFVANKKTSIDAAGCGGPNPTDKTTDHGEELIINVI